MTDTAKEPAPHRGRATATAYVRPKQTPAIVRITDKVADWTISIGGLFVIVAVFGIMVFLIQVVVPLFTGADLRGTHSFIFPSQSVAALTTKVDETRTVALQLLPDGRLQKVHLPTGTLLEAEDFALEGKKVTAYTEAIRTSDFALGFEDGTVRFGELDFRLQVVTAADLPQGLRKLTDTDSTDGSAVYSAIGANQFRRIAIGQALREAQKISDNGQAITHLDYRVAGTVERPTRSFATLDAAGIIRLSRAETRVNLLTRRETTSVQTTELPKSDEKSPVVDILLTSLGDQVYVAHAGGVVDRYDTRDFGKPTLAESRDLVPTNAELTSIGFLIGEQAIVVGGADGSVNVFFRIEAAGARTTDGYATVLTHDLENQPARIVAMAPSPRNKIFVTSDVQGNVWIRHSTSGQVLLKLRGAEAGAVFETMALSPRVDGLLAVTPQGKAQMWVFDIPHPETTLGTIFGKVWYEGFPRPDYTWQSSSGTDEFEPKFSLIPLIFGTIKATIYSLLFAVPIALMAAIFTSEFVHPRVRSVVKPAMEMMASLPSVVLGFIAALVLAPIVESFIAAVILAFVVVPLSLFAGAFLWQLLPQDSAIRFNGLPRFALMFVVLGLGISLAVLAGPFFESAFFAGDFAGWVNGTIGGGTPFTWLLLLPLSYVAVSIAGSRLFGAELARRMRSRSRPAAGLLDGARWLAVLVVSALVAYVLASLLTVVGFDPRGGAFDTYVQRNTLVVGFAMGFAVIPIIYTIAEDAMTAVPEHLRAASLACGATPWQTATKIIVPTAMSGIFAAVMIGMGRAVGETMIVVMAAGNTPILDWNLFNGLRALSANIAVELPEAVLDGSLYRMLFLAGLTLFVMTFILNTMAEIIRQRFRKRAVQL